MATQTLEELLVAINASTDQLREELGKGTRTVNKFGKDVDATLSGIDKRFKKLTGGIGRTVAGFATALASIASIREIGSTINQLEEVGRQADSLGSSVESIQELTLTFREFNLESNDVSDALGTIADRAQDAQDGMQSFVDDFALLGVSVDDLRGKRRRASGAWRAGQRCR